MSLLANEGELTDEDNGGDDMFDDRHGVMWSHEIYENDPDKVYEGIYNLNSTFALVGSLFLSFLMSVDGATINLEELNICSEFQEYIAQGANYKLSDGDENGCEAGCVNIWQTCYWSHRGLGWYRVLSYVAVFMNVLLVIVSVRMLLLISVLPRSRIKPFVNDLGCIYNFPTALVVLSMGVFMMVCVLQASLVMDMTHFMAILGVCVVLGIPFLLFLAATTKAALTETRRAHLKAELTEIPRSRREQEDFY